MKNNISLTLRTFCTLSAGIVICLFCITNDVNAQSASENNPQAKEIIAMMNHSTGEWDKGNLSAFMNIYDPSATMMMPGGDVKIDSIRSLYQHKYFKGNMPKQHLRYSDMKVRFLGKDYALLTGAFTLYGNNLPERSGRYSLVMVHTSHGWKILHDHSS